MNEETKTKWTHFTISHNRCRLLENRPDKQGNMPIEVEHYGYEVVKFDSLRHIDPKLGQRDVDTLQQFYSWCVNSGKALNVRVTVQQYIDLHGVK
ncbi:hypothetical protein AD45P4_00340 [Alteromonas phage vB_AmaP_AD45-P4]|nr:hypothetical protein AD45P3_00345 [Alteromonas phage vB_AmaP_AD45-P3]AGM47123.1 hypothetical protein AD45P4_00340 [Alteromonas phage vB_AmaP_AD45-P4]